MGRIKENIEMIEAGKKRLKQIEEKKKQLGKEPKLTKTVEAFLQITGLSLKKALSRGFVDINVEKGKYFVTSKGNNYKQRMIK